MSAGFDLAERSLHLFTREQYHQMAAKGILKPRDRVELINGRIVTMLPLGPWHCGKSDRLNQLLHSNYAGLAIVRAGGSVGLGEWSEPVPDFTILRQREDFYEKSHPAPEDVILVVEVSDSSRVFDLGTKQDLYAEHGIAKFWVIDKKVSGIHVFRDPVDGKYRDKHVYRSGDSIPLPKCKRATLKVNDIFG